MDKPTIVFVHGAWAGGWEWKTVGDMMVDRGWRVYRPTMTGLGERMHLAHPDIDLDTHIEDIVNVILFEDLHGITLLGHSYGGMVITGVADRLPGRVSHLIYVDAFLPEDGECVLGEHPEQSQRMREMEKDGFLVPGWVQPGDPYPHNVPHPAKTMTEPIRLTHAAALATIPSTYILMVDPGAEGDRFSSYAARAEARGWPVRRMRGGHVPQVEKPTETLELLLEVTADAAAGK